MHPDYAILIRAARRLAQTPEGRKLLYKFETQDARLIKAQIPVTVLYQDGETVPADLLPRVGVKGGGL